MGSADEDTASKSGRTSAIDEAQALSTLLSALAPLEQSTRIKLLRTMATFFEFSAEDVLAVAAAQGPKVPTATASERPSASSFSEDRSLSAKAFLLEKRPQSDVERIACLAYYLTHYRDQPTFKTLDLSKLNTEAAQIKLSNPTRAVDNAAGAHFLIPAGQGKKQLSAIGEVYVQALPDRTAARDAISDLKRKRAKKARYSEADDNIDSSADSTSSSESGPNGGN